MKPKILSTLTDYDVRQFGGDAMAGIPVAIAVGTIAGLALRAGRSVRDRDEG